MMDNPRPKVITASVIGRKMSEKAVVSILVVLAVTTTKIGIIIDDQMYSMMLLISTWGLMGLVITLLQPASRIFSSSLL